jgi:4-hydroxybenzoyl-CoA reductase beta subunit
LYYTYYIKTKYGILYTIYSSSIVKASFVCQELIGSENGRENRRKKKMRLPPFQYLAPRSTQEALEMIDRYKGKLKIIAGGTDIINRLRQRLLSPHYAMTLKEVSDLKGMKKKKAELVISAATTLREIVESPDVSGLAAGISQSAGLVAAPPIRNIATLGGNLLQNSRCLYYNQSELVRKAALPCLKQGGKACAALKGGTRCFSVYQGDLAPSLIAFSARVVLKKAGASRTVPVLELFSKNGRHPLTIGDDEILTDIIIPIPKGAYGSSYQKLRLRSGLEYPLVSSSAFLSVSKQGVIDQARVVVGAVGPAPLLVEEASAFLVGRRPAQVDVEKAAQSAFSASRPIDNLALPGSYRRKMVKVFTKRAIEAALLNLQKAGA